MEALNALKEADDVKTFPSIDMPLPLFRPHRQTQRMSKFARQHKSLFYNNSTGPKKEAIALPGLLKTRKTKLVDSGSKFEGETFAGFDASSVKLDLGESKVSAYDSESYKNSSMRSQRKGATESVSSQGESMVRDIYSKPGSSGHSKMKAQTIDLGSALHSIPGYSTMAGFQNSKFAQSGKFTPTLARTNESAKDLNGDSITLGGSVQSRSKALGSNNTHAVTNESTLEELRNYITLMDKYSLHNFMIYEGRTLTETPEFQSFKRTYQYKWGAISHIITQLEEFFQKNDVKLAIINGPRLFELSKLNLPVLTKKDMYSMITNIDQIEILMDLAEAKKNENQVQRVILRVQTLMRGWIARIRFRKLQRSLSASILLQSIIRRFLYRKKALKMLREAELEGHAKFAINRSKIGLWWQSRVNNLTEDRTRLMIYIPSISIAEYLRMDCENFAAIQNSHISNIFQLQDPDLHLIYVTPFLMSGNDKAYHEKFLSLLGVSILPRRLHFVTPEQIHFLPQHLSLGSALWYSPGALNKIRAIMKRFRSVVIVPASVTWVEKRISTYLDLPLLGTDSNVAETICSRSFLKTIFMDCSANIPLGAHDIHSADDMMVALSRLISSNVGVSKWIIRLNHDWNNESVVVLDAEKIPLIMNLRAEQQSGHADGAWFSREVQLSVRKRVLQMLKKEFTNRIRICRRDIYKDWEYYCTIMKHYGAVVEAEPLEKIGYVDGICFVDPTGEIHDCKGIELHVNDQYQVENYIYPQIVTPKSALEGGTAMIAKYLFETYNVVGYVGVQFLSFWDSHDEIPRLWAMGLQLGMRAIHGALGTTAIASKQEDGKSLKMPLSLMPTIPEGKFFLHIPVVVHDPLKSSHDDAFFKVCRMRGIAFDIKNRVGTLFFLVDSVVGGAISILCIGSTRKKAIELAVHTLTFLSREFGMDTVTNPLRYENLTTMLINLKKLLREQESIDM